MFAFLSYIGVLVSREHKIQTDKEESDPSAFQKIEKWLVGKYRTVNVLTSHIFA